MVFLDHFFPPRKSPHQVEKLVADFRAVKVAAAVDKNFLLRMKVNQVIGPLIGSQDAGIEDLLFVGMYHGCRKRQGGEVLGPGCDGATRRERYHRKWNPQA